MKFLRRSALLLLVSLSACGTAASPVAAAPVAASPGAPLAAQWWPRLSHEMVGQWHATTESGRSLSVSYRLTSRGSALVESWSPGSPGETITVFHRDGASMLLTHYCGQGNQATLRAESATDERLVYRRIAVTNESSDQSVLSELTLYFRESGTLERTEVYTDSDGVEETSHLSFTRVDS